MSSTLHDRIFKEFLRRFLPQFLQTFFPAEAEQLDLTSYTVLDQELISNFPDQALRVADFVAEVPRRDGGSEVVLVHIEIEARDKTTLPQRMFEYYTLLRVLRRKSVWPLALVLAPRSGGLGWRSYTEHLFEHEVVRFTYAQVGLRDMPARTYVAMGSPVAAALTALMDLSHSDPAVIKLAALYTVVDSGLTEGDKRFLIDVMGTYLATQDLPPSGEKTMEALQEIEMTWLERAEHEAGERGLERGVVAGKRQTLIHLLEVRFGSLPADLATRLEALQDEAVLDTLLERLLSAQSLAEFTV